MGMRELHQLAKPLLGYGCHCGAPLSSPSTLSTLSSLPPVATSEPAPPAAPPLTKAESKELLDLRVQIRTLHASVRPSAVLAGALLCPSSNGAQSRWTLATKTLVPGGPLAGRCRPGLALLPTLLEQAVLLHQHCHYLLWSHRNQ